MTECIIHNNFILSNNSYYCGVKYSYAASINSLIFSLYYMGKRKKEWKIIEMGVRITLKTSKSNY